jgi:hypothetical protein
MLPSVMLLADRCVWQQLGNLLQMEKLWQHIHKAEVKHKKQKNNELYFCNALYQPTSSQTSGLFLSDKNFSITGSLFSSAAFRNLGTSTGSV